jgi:hypothetical protein
MPLRLTSRLLSHQTAEKVLFCLCAVPLLVAMIGLAAGQTTSAQLDRLHLMHGSSLAKLLGALFSAIFGIYGIGAQTRNENGQLNRAGWISLVGLVVSMVVTVTGQYLEDQEHFSDAKAETQRYERLLSSAYYAALSTQGAKVDLGFSISMEDLKGVAPGYAERLDTIYKSPKQKGCTEEHPYDSDKNPGLSGAVKYVCSDYVYEDDTLSRAELRFNQYSTLTPHDNELFAKELIGFLGVYFKVEPTEGERKFFRYGPPLFKVDRTCEREQEQEQEQETKPNVGKAANNEQEHAPKQAKACPKDAQFIFEGDVLHVAVLKRDWDHVEMEKANLTSVIDLLGRRIVLTPNDIRMTCPAGKESQCNQLHQVLVKSMDCFALTFPHRRDIIFESPPMEDEKNGFVLVVEAQAKYYKHLMPKSVEDLPITDRRDPRYCHAPISP